MNELQYPYRLKGRHAFVLTSMFVAPIVMLLLVPAAGERADVSLLRDFLSFGRGGLFMLLIPVMAIAVPLRWFFSRHDVLRLTGSELRVGKTTLPLAQVQRIKRFDQPFTRAMTVEAGNRKVAVNQMMLPSRKAFEEVYEALTRNLRS